LSEWDVPCKEGQTHHFVADDWREGIPYGKVCENCGLKVKMTKHDLETFRYLKATGHKL
jgi:hypothetical protein